MMPPVFPDIWMDQGIQPAVTPMTRCSICLDVTYCFSFGAIDARPVCPRCMHSALHLTEDAIEAHENEGALDHDR